MQQIDCHELSEQPVTATEPQAGCRFCRKPLTRTFVDLGMSPLCESYLEPVDLSDVDVNAAVQAIGEPRS